MAQRLVLFYLLLCLVAFSLQGTSQSIRINEIVASNNSFEDEDGDTPDWIELYNYGSTAVSLDGMSLTDDLEKTDKWIFPDISIDPGKFLIIFASDKGRIVTGSFRTLVTQGDEYRYLIPTEELEFRWLEDNFDDSAWAIGASGFGYGDGDDVTQLPSGTQSVYLRKEFTIADHELIEQLYLDIDYDDGFRAFINGQFVCGANIDGIAPAYDATTIVDHEANIYQGGLPDRFEILDPKSILRSGTNLLSIQTHNVNANSSDFTVIPFLSAYYSERSTEGIPPPQLVTVDNSYFHTNFKISTSGETIALYSKSGELIDSLNTGSLSTDISIGVPQNDPSVLKYFETPTPGLPNINPDFWGFLEDKLTFSKESGNTSAFMLSLSGAGPSEIIRYTIDGSKPSFNSNAYQGPIPINQTTVVRASLFRNGYIQSKPQSCVYLINIKHELPIISLVVDPDDFLDEESGIYSYGDQYNAQFPHFGANFWRDQEKPVHISVYDGDGTLGIALDGGIKIFGGYSRAFDQRSLSLFARKSYGTEEIEYPLFKNLSYESFGSVILRNSGNDWLTTNIRDASITTLMSYSGLETQAYQPYVTYINGEYWGIYNMREKINEHFLSAKSGFKTKDIDFLELNGIIKHGTNEDFLELFQFIEQNNLADSENYNAVNDQIDIENHILYNVAQIYFDNRDWPGNNLKYWREKEGKWRWILFDTDFGLGMWNLENYRNNTLAFALETNGPDWPNPPWATLLFRKLIQNETYRNGFVNRMADEMNSRFLPENVAQHIDSIAALVSPEIQDHFKRWNGFGDNWVFQVANLKTFASNRPREVKSHILTELNLPAYHQLSVTNQQTDKGLLVINDRLRIGHPQWRGDYFEEVPITVTAVPLPGYKFSHWKQGSQSNDSEITLDLKSNRTVEPSFISDGTSTSNTDKKVRLKIYPNPTTDLIKVLVTNPPLSPITIRLLDERGAELKDIIDSEVMTSELEIEVNLENHPAGIYFLELSGPDVKTSSFKVLKQ